jgi:hypothetical protein
LFDLVLVGNQKKEKAAHMTETTTKQTFDYLVTFWNGSTVIIKAKTNTQARQIAKQITRRTISATRIA